MAIYYNTALDRTFHALGDGTRRKMLATIAKRGECTASELGKPCGIAQPTASKHIRVLERAGLVSRRVEGRVHRFRLSTRRLNEADNWIRKHRDFWIGSLARLDKLIVEITNKEAKGNA